MHINFNWYMVIWGIPKYQDTWFGRLWGGYIGLIGAERRTDWSRVVI